MKAFHFYSVVFFWGASYFMTLLIANLTTKKKQSVRDLSLITLESKKKVFQSCFLVKANRLYLLATYSQKKRDLAVYEIKKRKSELVILQACTSLYILQWGCL